jgi:hypothetical protein
LSMMLFSSLMGFAAALYVRRVDRIEAPESPNCFTRLGAPPNDT